ncbi:MAG: DNA translocase FtsK [Clostridia bacterium]
MAQKKTATRKTSARRKKPAPRRMTQKQRAHNNHNWAFLLFFLALLALLAVLNIDAVFLKFLGASMRGLIGIGSFAVPICLVIAGVLLILSRGKPIRARVICALITPWLIGCLGHAFIGGRELLSVPQMMAAGETLAGGGLLSGYITALGITWISRIATIVLFFVAAIATALAALNMTIMAVYDKVRGIADKIPRGVEYEDDVEQEEYVPIVSKSRRASRRKSDGIDIPLDGEELNKTDETQTSVIAPPEIKLPKSAVKTPAEALAAADEVQDAPVHINQNNFDIQDIPVELVEKDTPLSDISNIAAEEPPEEPGEGFEIPSEIEGEQKEMYNYPPISLLNAPKPAARTETQDDLRANAAHLAEVIKSFGIEVHILNIVCGPSVTRYEIQLDPGVKFSRLTGLADDIALALSAASVFIAPIPNKSAIGIEVPNKTVQMVYIQEVISSKEFIKSESSVTFAMGKDISGNCMIGDIAKLPHLLIAGTTGSGKSVCMNSIIISLLYKSTPEQVRLIMIDPKMVELGIYNGIPHLLVPVVTDPRKASGALQWAVLEMMKRYKLFAESNVRDMQSYNRAIEKHGEGEPLPQIVIVIDELADLMVVARKEVEDSIMRLTQMARAAGMHLIIATQRPSVDVITGVIKSNIPSRIAFAVASKIESNIILGSMGAEKLIGRGDMLFSPIGANKPTRIQGCFISGEEVEAVVAHVKMRGDAEYSEEIIEQIERQAEQKDSPGGSHEELEEDEMLDSAIDIVMSMGQASVSMLQRKLKLGYSRAARIVDQMEERGIVGSFEGAKPRQLLISKEQWQEIKMRRENL